MNEFYRIETVSFFDDIYAYNETAPGAIIGKKGSGPHCPQCGNPIGTLKWLAPRKVILSKPMYGDFVSGSNFLVSERVKSAYIESNLKGIINFNNVEVSRVRYTKNVLLLPPQYYSLDLEYSFARVDLNKSIIMGKPTDRYCPLCSPFGTTIDSIKSIYIDDTNWGGEDIFHLHELGSSVYASKRFIDFCIEQGFTNLKHVNTKDYVS